MIKAVLREIQNNEIENSVEVIRKSFGTVAKDFGLTKENCPTNGLYFDASI